MISRALEQGRAKSNGAMGEGEARSTRSGWEQGRGGLTEQVKWGGLCCEILGGLEKGNGVEEAACGPCGTVKAGGRKPRVKVPGTMITWMATPHSKVQPPSLAIPHKRC